jgi:hypothetical protein
VAFKIWKNRFSDKEDVVKKLSLHRVQERTMCVGDSIIHFKDNIITQNNTIGDLNSQNKVLIENTISGQKLALSI